MYIPLLITKYLAKRRIAWVSLVAVMLCTALVLVVISVMSGWLGMFRASFKGLSGDIVIAAEGRAGFSHAEKMLAELRELPEVAVAVPTVEALGLIDVAGQVHRAVEVVGLPLEEIGGVNDFPASLTLNNPDRQDEVVAAWRAAREAEVDRFIAADIVPADRREEYLEAVMQPVEAWAAAWNGPTFDLPWPDETYRNALSQVRREVRQKRGPDAATYPGIIAGSGVVGRAAKADGEELWTAVWADRPVLAKLILLAVEPGRGIDVERDKAEFSGWIVDTSHTGVFDKDDQTVYADFAYLQNVLGMSSGVAYPDGFDPETGQPVGEPIETPARVSKIHIAVSDGFTPNEALPAIEKIARGVLQKNEATTPIFVGVWDQQRGIARFLAAVEKERALVVTLFGFISIVAVFLILCVFYMIVKEKTRDIGILKSVGATEGGIACIFLGYGAIIGLVGGLLGVGVGSVIVWRINEIHDLMSQWLGLQIWSADTYMFDRIPNTVALLDASVILAASIVSSVVGAVVPALLAARQKPVESLRFE